MDITDKIEDRIKSLDKVSAYEIMDTRQSRWEFYFIRHRLDQNRAVNTRTIDITLYTDIKEDNGETYLGKASGKLSATASDEEIDKLLSDMSYQAGLVKNKPYTLTDVKLSLPEKDKEYSAEKIAEDFIKAMQRVTETDTEDVNSYEIFVDETERSFRNSNGVCYSVSYPSSMIEVVINARKESEEIELYRCYRSGTCDPDKLVKDITDTMKFGRDRLVAKPTPTGLDIPVIFSTDDSRQLYWFFMERMSAGLKYRKVSDYEQGKEIVKRTGGDKLTIEALRSLKDSSEDYPVDEEGSEIKTRFIIKDDIAENFWGRRQFSQYLGLTDSSEVNNFRVYGGSQTAEELRKGDYLELVEFSDFQVDAYGGDIAGEIRLGYLHLNGETKVISGGSVSGSMIEAAADMAFSKETVQYNRVIIPAVTRLNGLRITGVE